MKKKCRRASCWKPITEAAILSNLLVSLILVLESEWPLLRSLPPQLTKKLKVCSCLKRQPHPVMLETT